MTGKRTARRHRRRIRVSLGITPVFTADISAGGFSAEILRAPEPGTKVDGTIRLDRDEVRYSGLVVWAMAGSPRLNLRGRVGVRFTSLPASAARLLSGESLPSSSGA